MDTGVRYHLDHLGGGPLPWRWDVVIPGDATDHRPRSVQFGYARTRKDADAAAFNATLARIA